MPASSRRAAVLSSSIASTTSSRVPGGCWATRQGSSSSPPTAATSTGKAAPGKIAAVSGASSTTSSPRSRKALATVGSLPARSVINGVIGIDSSGIDANYSAESNSKRFHGRRTLFNVTAPARLGDLPFYILRAPEVVREPILSIGHPNSPTTTAASSSSAPTATSTSRWATGDGGGPPG